MVENFRSRIETKVLAASMALALGATACNKMPDAPNDVKPAPMTAENCNPFNEQLKDIFAVRAELESDKKALNAAKDPESPQSLRLKADFLETEAELKAEQNDFLKPYKDKKALANQKFLKIRAKNGPEGLRAKADLVEAADKLVDANNALNCKPQEVKAVAPEQKLEVVNGEYTKNFAEDFHKTFQGFTSDQIAIDSEVKFDGAPEERSATASFSDRTLRSREEIADFLDNSDKKAQAVRQQVENALKDRPEELARALSGEGYVAVQTLVPIVIKGTTFFMNGEVRTAHKDRRAEAGDAFWLYVDLDGHIVLLASFRADCVNPGFELIRPLKSGEKVLKVDVPNPGPYRQPSSSGSREVGDNPRQVDPETGYGSEDPQPVAPETQPSQTPTHEPSPNPGTSPDPNQNPPKP